MNARVHPITLAALITLAACGGSESDGAATTVASAPTPTAASSTAAPDDEASTEDQTSNGGEASNASATVMIDRSRFDNTELRVAVGTTVTFVNNDAFDHTVTSRDDSPVQFDSGTFGQGETFEFTFDEPGEFSYFCEIHPTMRAVVIVE